MIEPCCILEMAEDNMAEEQDVNEDEDEGGNTALLCGILSM
jgi:hypothetical protein